VLEAGEKTVVLARLVARRHDGSLETHPVVQVWRFQDGRGDLVGSYVATVEPRQRGSDG